MMKIGVVCEGATDFFAIKHYVGAALSKSNVSSEFVALQPNPDNTSGGGWPQVLTWLERNPPKQRLPLFSKGLFENSSRLSGLDILLIQLDTDILPEDGFHSFVRDRGLTVGPAISIMDKAAEISKVLLHFAKISELDHTMQAKHIAAPIAEASEAWCVAADSEFMGDPETLSGQSLTDQFGATLARFSKNPVKPSYARVNKTIKTRDQYCEKTAENVHLVGRCSLFKSLLAQLT